MYWIWGTGSQLLFVAQWSEHWQLKPGALGLFPSSNRFARSHSPLNMCWFHVYGQYMESIYHCLYYLFPTQAASYTKPYIKSIKEIFLLGKVCFHIYLPWIYLCLYYYMYCYVYNYYVVMLHNTHHRFLHPWGGGAVELTSSSSRCCGRMCQWDME